MLTSLRRLFTDEIYFEQKVRGLIAMLGVLLGSGIIDLGAISEHLGPAGWWLGKILVPVAIFIRSGDKNAKEPKT